MNRNKAMVIILFFSILVTGIESCTKKDNGNNSFSRIQGEWKLEQTATDDNQNGVIDGNEIKSVPYGSVGIIYFNGDSTGIISTIVNGDSAPNIHFHWKLTYGDSLWIASSAHDTLTYFISQLNSSNLVLALESIIDTGSNRVLTQYYYNKY